MEWLVFVTVTISFAAGWWFGEGHAYETLRPRIDQAVREIDDLKQKLRELADAGK